MTKEEYKERLMQRQRQEHADKGKTGLGRKSILDFGRAAGKAINLWTPRFMPEINAFDIIPFVITQEWYRKLKMPSGRPNGLEAGMWDYKLQVPVHRNVGPNNDIFLCLREAFGGRCFECDEMFEAYKAGDEKKAGDLRPGWRCFYNIYDYDDPQKGIQLFESSYYTFESATKNDPQRANLIDAMMLDDTGIVVFYDLEEGSTIVAKFKKKYLGKNEFAEVSEINFEKRDPYDKTILQQVYPLDSMLIIPKPEEVQRAALGLDESDGEEVKEKQEPPAKRKDESEGKRSRGATAQQSTVTDPPKEEPARGRSSRSMSEPTQQAQMTQQEDTRKHICPAGKTFGKDCNTGPECEGKGTNPCNDETFAACSEAYNESQKNPGPAVQEPAKANEPQKAAEPESPGDSGRRRRR